MLSAVIVFCEDQGGCPEGGLRPFGIGNGGRGSAACLAVADCVSVGGGAEGGGGGVGGLALAFPKHVNTLVLGSDLLAQGGPPSISGPDAPEDGSIIDRDNMAAGGNGVLTSSTRGR